MIRSVVISKLTQLVSQTVDLSDYCVGDELKEPLKEIARTLSDILQTQLNDYLGKKKSPPRK